MSQRRRSNTAPLKPMRGRATRMSRAALAASVSAASILLASAFPSAAQEAGTLPGTVILQGGRWVGAKLPTVAQGNNGMVMTIEQEQKRALLDWSRFDVAKNEEVRFEQDGVDWIALNRIFDTKPSEIAGRITARGQVWLQNTNGIIFKDGAQVNAHTILATALPISENQLYNGLLSGQGVIRGTTSDPLFSGINRPMVPKPVQGLDPGKLLETAPTAVGGETPTIIDLLARAAIRMAVLRENGEAGVDQYNSGYGLSNLTYYDSQANATRGMVDYRLSTNGLGDVMEAIVGMIDVSKLGDYNYADYTNLSSFWQGISWQGIPPGSQSIPQALRDEVAAMIKAQFIDNYASLVATRQQAYDNYVLNSRITVESGATLRAASEDGASPGKIMLFGPNVSNAGRLEAHDGQVLLAAGEQVKLSAGQGFTNSARGGLAANVMAVATVDSYGSYPNMPCCTQAVRAAWEADVLNRTVEIGMTATNSGQILADRGAVTMVGANVDQLGSILVTNGVRQRSGTIVLQASHGFNISDYSVGGNYFAGKVTLGEGSVTSITPDMSDTTGLAADTFDKGRILVAGNEIVLEEDSSLISRSGEIVIHANPSGTGARGGSSPASTDGSYMETRGDKGSFVMKSGALIDVSGLADVERSVADNVFAVEIRSNEVAGSPKQRDGILVGETVYVDRRTGASIVDWTGALAGEQRTAAQMSTEGGTVQIRASEYAIVENGALIDVSGGSTKYTDAQVTVTRLRDSFGRFHDISKADPNLRYVGIDQSTRTEQGYVEGANAGSVELLSGSARLFGNLKGDVVTGERQILAAMGQIAGPRVPTGAVGANYITTAGLPKAGSAVLHRGGPDYAPWTSTYSFIVADDKPFTTTLWTEDGPNGLFTESDPLLLDPYAVGTSTEEGTYEYDPETDPLWMSKGHYDNGQPRWVSFIKDDFFAGMGDVSLSYGSSHQTQAINSGVSIRLAPGGRFTTGSESGIGRVGDDVSFIVPSGEILLAAGDGMTIGKDVLFSVSAPWINDVDAPADAVRGYVDGGSINLIGAKLTGDITLDAGGGGWYRKVTPGQNSQGEGVPTAVNQGQYQLIGGKGGDILLGGGGLTVGEILDLTDISLGGLSGGGMLSLFAGGNVVIGAAGGSAPGAEYIVDTLFRDMGAGSLTLGADTLTVASDANLLFQARNMMIRGLAHDVATGTDLREVSDLVLLPEHQRTGGSLNLLAENILIEAGALVSVDALGSITLAGSQGSGGVISVDGTLRAHGGRIDVGGSGGGQVLLGAGALLDASGIAQTVKVPGGVDGRGFWYDGRIVDGGSVWLRGSYVVTDPESTIDVSGSNGLLSVLQPGRYMALKVTQTIGSDAGVINLDASGGYLLGNLRGDAGSINNFGGRLNISGGADGKLLLPGDTDWSTGEQGLQSLLSALQWSFYPEPTPESPASLRDLFANNYGWVEQSLGFGPGEIEDIQITSLADFQDFLRVALSPLVKNDPSDVNGALVLDPTMTAMPDVPPPAGRYALPDGYTPASMGDFERAMTFLLVAIGNVSQPDQLARGTRATVGANVLRDMKTFDTLSVAGKLESESPIEISSQRVLTVAGGFNSTKDMTFSSRNIYLGGGGVTNFTPDAATAGTLTVSGETIEFSGQFEVGGFENVVLEAQGDMRGGYAPLGIQPVVDGPDAPGVNTTGNLVLRAAQIYPTTDGVLRFTAGEGIRVERTGRREAPLSAGGLLVLEAPTIEQAGTLRAPFGEIRLNATGREVTVGDGETEYVQGSVTLLPGSVTSTAADGRTILYGYTYDGQSWYAPTSVDVQGPTELSTPPEKRVSLNGDVIDVQNGALIDVSGSGDVLGLEFVAGPLGQTNILNEPGNFAIVPAYGDDVIAPIDPLYNPGLSSDVIDSIGTPGVLPLGSRVWLAAFDGHPAGWYTLLPAEYALTPGGYLISLEANTPAVPDARVTGDDSMLVLGRRGVAGTEIADQTMSTYRLTSGKTVREKSEFFETYGNSFFSSERFLQGLLRSGNPYNADPRLPVDGGFLTLAANSELKLDGTILAGGANGLEGARGGIVDITSDNIVVAAPGTDVSDLEGYLVLDPNKLSGIAESLLIGGVRRQGKGGLEIIVGQESRESAGEVRSAEKSIGAENVVVRTDAANPLTGTELLFAANQSVRVESGAVVRAEGNGADAVDLAIAPSMPVLFDQSGNLVANEKDTGGAFLRVSNLGDIKVSRRNVDAESGNMIVEAGATLEAADSILLDATQDTLVGNGAVINAGAITAAAGLVSLGDVPSGTDGLVFAGETLDALTGADKLTLKSYSSFDFHGDVTLNLEGAIVLDGAALAYRGDAPGHVAISANTVELRNSDAAPIDAVGNGGTLAISGKNVVFGAGDMDVAFDTTSVDAGQRVIFSGLGDNSFDGALTMTAAEFTGDSGAGHIVTADGALRLLAGDGTAELPAFSSAGALLDFRGSEVDMAATIRAGSGVVRATATEGDVRLGANALVDVRGADVSFFEVQGFLPGGGIQLTSVDGDVLVAEGAVLDISGGTAGGDAGSLAFSAGRGVVELGGTLKADVAEGYRSGSFALTTSTLDDFGGLNALLNASGFARSRDFAILDGDVVLNGTTRVDALRIVTGNGDISVAADAVIGSDSDKGGSILLASGGNLTIADGAKFDVNAKGENQRGGSVDLQVAAGGVIDAGAAMIDVSGTGTGKNGQVRLRAAQTGSDVGVSRWAADVTGGDTQLEAFRVYELADADGNATNGHLAEIDTALQQQVIADATAFMDANGDAIRARLGLVGDASFNIVPGIELRSEGDMDLVHNWNLNAARFNGKAGVLTLRAGGDLTINANLSDGFVHAYATPESVDPGEFEYGWMPGDSPVADAPASDFTNDESWSYNLVAGADFAQTNVLSTQAGNAGGIEVGGLVRTGTGDIKVAASGDLTYEAASLVTYQGSWNESDPAALIVVPAGTPVMDGTVLKPTTYAVSGGMHTIYPELPAGTVLRKGTKLPAGTEMPDGSVLPSDTVLADDVTLTASTSFPGEVVIAGKTYLGGDLVWEMASNRSNDPTAATQNRTVVSIAGLGDVEVRVVVNGGGDVALVLADARYIRDESSFNLGDVKQVEMVNGAIYTVGVEDAPIGGFTDKNHIGFESQGAPGIVIHRAYMTDGGDVSVNVGGAITGAGTILENYRWMAASGGTPTTSLFGYGYPGKDPDALFNTEVAQYQPDRTGQTALSLLADRFVQGIGALGGGDVSITSGGDVDNLVVALPTWVRVSGGTEAMAQKTVHLSGGGDLVMNVGQNVRGGLVQVGKGRATIDVAGSVIATDQMTTLNSTFANTDYLQLAIDDVQLSLQAGGDVNLRGVSSMLGVTSLAGWLVGKGDYTSGSSQPQWLGYTKDTSVRVTSLGGDINYYTQAGNYGGVNVLPSKAAFVATAGSISFGMKDAPVTRVMVDMWPDTRLDILAQQNVQFRLPGSYDGGGLTIGYADPLWVPRAINPSTTNFGTLLFQSTVTRDPLTGNWVFNQAGPGFGIDGANVHSGSDSYSRIYAAQGDMIGWNQGSYDYEPGNGMHGGTFTFGHETRLKAGGDIRMGEMTFITHDGSDIPTIEAGGSIYLPNAVLYGPGRLWVQAGDEVWMGRTEDKGIRAREAYSSIPTAAPLSGGSISVLAGIDQEPEYQAFFDYYLDPENLAEAPSWLRQYFVDGDREGLTVSTDVVLADGQTRTTVYAIELVNYMRGLRGETLIETEAPDEVSGSRPITRGALAAEIDPAEYAASLASFRALDPALQRPLAVRILNAELKTAGREAVGRSPETDGRYVRQGDPTRGYDAIGRLFPGAQRKPGEALADGEHRWTGNIEMMVSQIRGESGGDVDLITPGGSIQLASLSVANTNPGTAGIVTQRGGGINAITYGDYIVNQSRTMTADDGDIMIWSSYGNIDAGRGRKTSLSVPPVSFPIDAWATTQVQLSGLPNGAGIATLDQVDGKQGGDVDLYAFNGIVNAGDAGIRASRDLFVGAVEIRGLDNITVGGETNVDLTSDEGSVGPLNLENFAQSAEDEALDKAFDMAAEVEKLRTVRQTILTGSVVSFGTDDCVETDGERCPR